MEQLETFRQDLESLLTAYSSDQCKALKMSLGNSFAGLKVYTLPEWETLPNSPAFPSLSTRQARVKTLNALALDQSGQRVVLVTPQSYLQCVPSPDTLKAATLTLRCNDSISSLALRAQLLQIGYEPVELVEDVGTFSIRGDIIDIFPSNQDRPVRISRFGDDIESIQYFDPDLQRSLKEPLNEVLLPPAREVVLTSDRAVTLCAALKVFADDLGFPRPKRETLTETIHRGVYPEYADLYIPFVRPASFASYIPDARVVCLQPPSLLKSLSEFKQEFDSLHEKVIQGNHLTPSFDLLFPDAVASLDLLIKDAQWIANLSPILSTPLAMTVPQLVEVYTEVAVFCSSKSNLDRILYLKKEGRWPDSVTVLGDPSLLPISSSIADKDLGLLILSDQDYFGKRHQKVGSSKKKHLRDNLQALADLEPNDIAIHSLHGRCRYTGLARLDILGAPTDFLTLEFLGKDKLYLPVYRIETLQKVTASDDTAQLDKLGGTQFQKTKDQVREAVKKLAVDLLKINATRATAPGIEVDLDPGLMHEFASRFAFQETEDQVKAIEASLSDLSSGKIMDRLICGDVGFGKTEVAMRAAFATAMAGYQVAVLVPTTLLASQHEGNFLSRFEGYPLRVESLSRFKSLSAQKATLKDLAAGKIDVIIGTHRLLSKDISFQRLGLLVVDEEHRFGVDHKERIKELKASAHVLSLSATPIPRTLHMALSGLRDITLISTPPTTRLPVKTFVASSGQGGVGDNDRCDDLIKGAIEKELARNGQVFFVHNRVADIQRVTTEISRLVPSARVAFAHGQMGERTLEDILLKFIRHELDVLVTTTIIESGIDIPNCNTLIVNRADTFGLAQLYQIRGRVGRGDRRAFAYLLAPNVETLSGDAKKRLEVIQRFVELGSGFSVASHDLEIRGGGNILGPEQSGHVHAVGFDLYLELLDEAIQRLKGSVENVAEQPKQAEIRTHFPAFLPEDYVPDLHQRIQWYRKISVAQTAADFDHITGELQDRYGRVPLSCENLLWIAKLKQLVSDFGVDFLNIGPDSITMTASRSSKIQPFKTMAKAAALPSVYILTPDGRLIVKKPPQTPSMVYFFLEQLLTEIS